MKHVLPFVACCLLADLVLACGASERAQSVVFVDAPTDVSAHVIAPRVVEVPTASASVPDEAPPANPQSIETFKALAASICPSPQGSAAPTALSAGGQALWGTATRTMAVLITEIQHLEQSLNANPLDAALRFQLAMDYYELEVVAYKECVAAAATIPSRQFMIGQRTATINSRAKTMAAAAKMGKKYCAIVGSFSGFTPPGPCPL